MDSSSNLQSIKKQKKTYWFQQRCIGVLQKSESVDRDRNSIMSQQEREQLENLLVKLTHFTQKDAWNGDRLVFKIILEIEKALLFQDSLPISEQEIPPIIHEITAFRDKMVADQKEFQSDCNYRLLVFHADKLLSILTGIPSYHFNVNEILNVLTELRSDNSGQFLLQHVQNTQLWWSAVVRQRFDFEEEKDLFEAIIEMLGNTGRHHAWKILLTAEKVPYRQEIFQAACKFEEAIPYKDDFILQQITNCCEYFEEFMKYGIYEILINLILNTRTEKDQNIMFTKVQTILENIQQLWVNDDIFNNSQEILKSRILEYLFNIPIKHFNQQSLFIVFNILNKIGISSSYDIDPQISESQWLRKLFELLLFQDKNNQLTNLTIRMMKNLIISEISTESITILDNIIESYEQSKQIKETYY